MVTPVSGHPIKQADHVRRAGEIWIAIVSASDRSGLRLVARKQPRYRFGNGQVVTGLGEEATPARQHVFFDDGRCAILVENGDATALPQTVEMAIAAGRQYDAWQLQARMALISRDWKAALDLLGRIHRKDFFDLAVEYRALQLQKADPTISRDVVALEQIRLREEAIANNYAIMKSATENESPAVTVAK